MKRVKQNKQRRASRKSKRQLPGDRRGSVIVVVITLLATLMLLGFFLFSITQQEAQNAQYFSEASKKYEPLDVDPNTVFDCWLRQFILGADPGSEYNSIFYTGYNSLLPRFVGSDFAPYSGEGINVVWDPTNNRPAVDMDHDGIPDDGMIHPPAATADPDRSYMLRLNHSPAALGQVLDVWNPADTNGDGAPGPNPDNHWLPQPDVDKTYPDHDSPFLTYYGYVPTIDPVTGQKTGSQLVVIPAFHRPQLIRNASGPGLPVIAPPGTTPLAPPPGTWYSDPSTAARVFRPHQQHVAFTSTGAPAGVPRFPTAPGGNITTTFWSTVPSPDEGHWGHQNAIDPYVLDGIYQYDADPSGRGWNDAIYHDIGCSPQVDSASGRLFVPLFAATILDAESLFNLAVHGNTFELADTLPGGESVVSPTPGTFGFTPGNSFLSRSNRGMTRSEINPGWALNSGIGETSDATALQQYQLMFGHAPSDRFELSNMDLWFLFHGRADFDPAAPIPASLADMLAKFEGRYGEQARIDNGVNSRNSLDFPWPGDSAGGNADDNQNRDLGVWTTPNFGYPVDPYGIGNETNDAFGKQRRTQTSGIHKFPVFDGFASNQVVWSLQLAGNLMTGGVLTPIINDTLETLTDPQLAAGQSGDSNFTAAENAQLQLSRFDLSVTGTTGRLLNLALFNFGFSTREQQIRSRFATLSSDLKAYSKPFHTHPSGQLRNWEFGDSDTDGIPDFPPVLDPAVTGFGLNDIRQPFRPELRELLFQEVSNHNYDPVADFRKLQRKLSVNGVLDRNPTPDPTDDNLYYFRPLTAHPILTDSRPVTVQNPSFRSSRLADLPAGDVAAREILARIDRQKLARDIYTLLYVLGGGADQGVDYLRTPNNPPRNAGTPPSPATGLYTLDQCREMAQFAVNLVDYMDPDHVMTKFEYDTNLANGWNLDDYPYGGFGTLPPYNDIADISAGGERGVVYGLEEQVLCLSEAAAFYTTIAEDNNSNPFDHTGTEWDDTKQNQFLFVELENVSPYNLSGSNQFMNPNFNIYQVVIRGGNWTAANTKDTQAPDTPFQERRITLRGNAFNGVTTTPNGRFLTLGSAAEFQQDPMSGETVRNAPNFPSSNFVEEFDMDDSTIPGPARFGIAAGYTTSDPRSGGSTTPTTAQKLFPFSIAVGTSTSDIPNYLDLLNDSTTFAIHEAPTLPTDYQDGTQITGASAGADALYLPDPISIGTGENMVEIVLRRRANPNRRTLVAEQTIAANAEDNPWIVVDRMRVPLGTLTLDQTDTDTNTLMGKIEATISPRALGRYQPLFSDPSALAYHATSKTGSFDINTLGTVNSDSPAQATIWHHHANRDFVSLAEAFNVPLFGPDRLNDPTAPLYDADTGTPELDPDPTTGNGPWRGLTISLGEDPTGTGIANGARLCGRDTFGYRVLHPEGPDGAFSTTAGATVNNDNNRWHRVLAFLEVPSRQNLTGYSEIIGRVAAGQQDERYRNFGPLNVNTMRHPEVLGGMLDDPKVTDPTLFVPTANLPDVSDRTGDPYRRDWWTTFALSRDRIDPVLLGNSGVPGVSAAIPGIPGVSRPFRSLAYSSGGVNSIQHTLLRDITADDVLPPAQTAFPDLGPRQLFQVGNASDHKNFTIDYDLKNKLLGKIMNHSTTQSNTFIVFLQVDFFEADNLGNGVVQIGGKLPDSPGYRGFFVIDRAKALELLTRDDLPPTRDPNTGKNTFSFNQNFDWRALIVHRQRLN